MVSRCYVHCIAATYHQCVLVTMSQRHKVQFHQQPISGLKKWFSSQWFRQAMRCALHGWVHFSQWAQEGSRVLKLFKHHFLSIKNTSERILKTKRTCLRQSWLGDHWKHEHFTLTFCVRLMTEAQNKWISAKS